MAQTGRMTSRKLRAIAAVDALGRPAFALLRSRGRKAPPDPPRRILVVELWGIGDVVLATPALAELRDRLPNARVTLLGKAHARELLENSGLVDDVIVADFPWTAHAAKYAPSRYRRANLTQVFRELRSRKFDVSIDARRDLRSNIVTFLSGATRRIGYDFGGGSKLLTDVVPSGSQDGHRIDDWMHVLEPLMGEIPSARGPVLRVTDDEIARAEHHLRELGIPDGKTLIAIHPGASHPIRRLRADVVAAAAARIIASGAAAILIQDPGGHGSDFVLPAGVPALRPSLRELMAIISSVDGLVCSDSSAMHIAVALGTPVTAVFGPQRHEWLGPRDPMHRIVSITDMPCRPCFDACIYESPLCMDRIDGQMVVEAVDGQLAALAARTAEASAQGSGRRRLPRA
ncbi:MAG TPA: glycosyltransferase family 9 protein [Gemmatimonadaceae bacterium]|nr:glycosyltransferase family 9 protein [Gemmatimonadaceae bacterium]